MILLFFAVFLHEWAFLPHEEEYALYHHKDIKRQEKQNKYYATL